MYTDAPRHPTMILDSSYPQQSLCRWPGMGDATQQQNNSICPNTRDRGIFTFKSRETTMGIAMHRITFTSGNPDTFASAFWSFRVRATAFKHPRLLPVWLSQLSAAVKSLSPLFPDPSCKTAVMYLSQQKMTRRSDEDDNAR